MSKKDDPCKELYDAITHQREELVYSILKNYPEVDLQKYDCLHWTISHQSMNMVDLLIRSGVNVNSYKHPNSTPLVTALIHYNSVNRMQELKKLLDAGANPNITDSLRGTLLPIFMARNPEELQLLINYGADINIRDTKGWTPIMKFIEMGRMENLKFLLSCPQLTTINAPDQFGYTPLLLAIEKGATEAMKLLLKAGADVNCATPSGRSLMEIANPDQQKILKQYSSMQVATSPEIATPVEVRKEEAFPSVPATVPESRSGSWFVRPFATAHPREESDQPIAPASVISVAPPPSQQKSETVAVPPPPPAPARTEVPTANAVMIVEATNSETFSISQGNSADIGSLLERIRRLEGKVENCEARIQQQQRELEELRAADSSRKSKKWW